MRKLRGTITSDKMKNTVVVRVDRLKIHPKYKKHFRVSKKYSVDTDGTLDCKIGDIVEIQETRPISKKKRWKAVKVVKKMSQLTLDEQNGENSEATKQ